MVGAAVFVVVVVVIGTVADAEISFLTAGVSEIDVAVKDGAIILDAVAACAVHMNAVTVVAAGLVVTILVSWVVVASVGNFSAYVLLFAGMCTRRRRLIHMFMTATTTTATATTTTTTPKITTSQKT